MRAKQGERCEKYSKIMTYKAKMHTKAKKEGSPEILPKSDLSSSFLSRRDNEKEHHAAPFLYGFSTYINYIEVKFCLHNVERGISCNGSRVGIGLGYKS